MEQNLIQQKEELILKIRTLKKKSGSPKPNKQPTPAQPHKNKKDMSNYMQIKSLLFFNP